jgi:uncharacterized membrane protein
LPSGTQKDFLRRSSKDGMVKLYLEKNEYIFIIKVNNPSTECGDYMSSKEMINLTSKSEKSVYMWPVGNVIGRVYDNSGNIVSGAEVQYSCPGKHINSKGKTITEFDGVYSFEYLPSGQCTISAAHSDDIGFVYVEISKGEILTQDIPIKQKTTDFFPIYISIVFLIFLIALGLIFYNISKSPQKKKALQTKRQTDLMKTLDEHEIKIIEYLIQYGKTKSYKVRGETNIPKTSFFRYLKKLERKNIIHMSKYGNRVSVELTAWFTEK